MTALPPSPARPVLTPPGPLGRLVGALVARLLGSLPMGALLSMGRGLGALAFFLGIRRRVTLDNLRRALPEQTEAERRLIAQGAYATMACTVLEAIASYHHSVDSVCERVKVQGWEKLEALIRDGRGAVLASGHCGNWETMGGALALRGLPLSVVVKPLKGILNARIVASRWRCGVKLLGARGSVAASVESLARGESVLMLVDQVLPADRGVFVPFFGQLSSTTPAAALVARRAKAPVYLVLNARDGNGLKVVVEGPFEVPDTGDEKADLTCHTAELTAALERFIRAHPKDWLWLHRRWKVKPPA